MKNKPLRNGVGMQSGVGGGERNSGRKTRHSLQPNENNQPPSYHVLPVPNNYKQTRLSLRSEVNQRDPSAAARVRRWNNRKYRKTRHKDKAAGRK